MLLHPLKNGKCYVTRMSVYHPDCSREIKHSGGKVLLNSRSHSESFADSESLSRIFHWEIGRKLALYIGKLQTTSITHYKGMDSDTRTNQSDFGGDPDRVIDQSFFKNFLMNFSVVFAFLVATLYSIEFWDLPSLGSHCCKINNKQLISNLYNHSSHYLISK